MRSVFEPLMVSDHSARHGGAMRSMSSRNDREVLMKCVSSAYSTSSGQAQRRSQDFFLGGGQFSVNSGGRPDSVGGGGSSRNFPGSP